MFTLFYVSPFKIILLRKGPVILSLSVMPLFFYLGILFIFVSAISLSKLQMRARDLGHNDGIVFWIIRDSN
ncbi:hypothetical protein ATN88_21995 [Enterovibrio coralii]|uniref:Uncharacterized protein n=1 Tax=Enterovibrio coralii TaxID=294935 RepID=A0A135I4Q0_9GAMM|nr:hypothetical protein ATN88_21995 [Enterovibrio coralii]